MKITKHLQAIFLLIIATASFAQNTAPSQSKGGSPFENKPRLIRGPYLQSATDTSVVIRWRTDGLTRSRVRYGAMVSNLDKNVDDVKLATEHEIKISGLTPATKYFYSIGTLQDTLQTGDDNYFSTLPEPGQEGFYRIGVFGDCGSLSVNQIKVRDEFLKYMGKNDLNAWILLGDNAYNDGTDMEYQAKFFNIYKDVLLKKYPLFPSPGNHDYHDVDFTAAYAQDNHTTPYYQVFSMPVDGESGGVPSGTKSFYSFDIGNIHFLSLDSYGREENKYFLYDTLGPQMQWVKKDLAANKKEWVVVYTHFPPYSMTSHNSDTESGLYYMRENVIPILERFGVDLVVCGHSHGYERSRLMNGYYGKEADFDSTRYNMSNSSGSYNGSYNSSPYIKDATNRGTVYVVTGSSSYVGKGQATFPHDAMPYSNTVDAGAAIIEVRGNRLDMKWICGDGIIRDQFTMMKNVNRKTSVRVKPNEKAKLTASFISDEYNWNRNDAKGRTIEVKPTSAKTTYTVTDKYNYLKEVFEVNVSK